MVDRVLLASKIATVRDAVARVRAVLPATSEAFVADRTTREVVVLNLFVALQACISLAAHWLADAGQDVPQTYADVFGRLGEQQVLSPPLATRLASAAGFRNVVAHQYGALDWARVYSIASASTDDLLTFCDEIARRAG